MNYTVYMLSFPASRLIRCFKKAIPEELVEVSVLHVLKHHDERVALHAHSIESDNVFMLKVGQQLSLTVEILPGILTGLFKCLNTHKEMLTDILIN